MPPTQRLIKAFSDAIPLGEHLTPHNEFITVRLDFVQEAIDWLDWLDKGVEEWQQEAIANKRHAEAARATARIAIHHLVTVLEGCRTAGEQQAADTSAREWLRSIGAI